jgi:hypothetical protein
MKRLALVVVVALTAVIASTAVGPGVFLEVVSSVATSTGNPDSFTVLCTQATPARIAPPGGNRMMAYSCQNRSATLVAVGDATISDPGTTADANVYCNTSPCPSAEFGGGMYYEFCRGDVDTTITCRSSVTVTR